MASIRIPGRNFVLLASTLTVATAIAQPPPAAPGIKTPGISRPLSELKPSTIYQVAGSPDWNTMWLFNATSAGVEL